MFPRFALLSLIALIPFARVASADEPAKPKAGTTEHVLHALRQPVKIMADALPNARVADLLDEVATRHGLAIVVRTELFRDEGLGNPRESRPTVQPTTLEGISLHRLLTLLLTEHHATYVIRGGHIEIVPIAYAARVNRVPIAVGEGLGAPRIKEPLVSAIYKEKPLNEAVADLAEAFDLTIVVLPQSGDARTAFVSARLLNVPADRAIELLALQADLRVARKGAAFIITSPEHANTLLSEGLEQQRQKLEVDRFRAEIENLRKEPAPRPAPVTNPEK